MDFVELALIVGLSGFFSTLSRLFIAWLRSRHPRRARMKVGGSEVTWDLSDPKEAAQYLENLEKRTRGGN